eukprot:g3290.t1
METTALHLVEAGDDGDDSEDHSPPAPQCIADLRSIWRRHKRAIVVGSVAAMAGALLCLFLKPEPRLYSERQVPPTEVASWASSSSSFGIDLASEACSSGGLAEEIRVHRNYSSSGGQEAQFILKCRHPRLSRRAFVTLGITITSLCLMISGQPPDLCMLAATLALLLWPWSDTPGEGIISEKEAWEGFSNKGVLTVGILFVVAKAVDETGVVEKAMKYVLGSPRNIIFAQVRLLLPVAVSSAFMNNTPIVAMLIPVVETWARKMKRDPAVFLMPLSFSSMLGGMCSMMGTSTNLVVAGLMAKKNPDMLPFGLFDIAVVGAPCCLVGIIYMSIFARPLLGRKLLLERSPEALSLAPGTSSSFAKTYTVLFVRDASVRQDAVFDLGPISGLTMEEDGVLLQGILGRVDSGSQMERPEISVLQIPEVGSDAFWRCGKDGWGSTHLDESEYLAIRCKASSLGSLRLALSRQGLRLVSELPTFLSKKRLGRRRNLRFLCEAVVGPDTPVVGMPVGLGGEMSEVLLERYGAALVSARLGGSSQGSRRQAASQRDRAMSEPSIQQALIQIIPSQSNSTHQTTLRPGQVLLLEVFPASTQLMAQDFSLITTVPGSRPPRVGTFMDRARVYIAALVLIAMVTLSATVVSLLTAGLLASFILLSIKTIPLKTALSAIRGRTLLAIVTTFGVGTAFETTGLAHWIASGLSSIFGQLGSLGVLLSVSLVTSIVGCAVSNNAVVILMYPICETLAAQTEGVHLRQLLVVLLVGASSSFLTPMSYQTNLMVYTPGNYKFADYFKFGIGLQIVVMVTCIAMATIFKDYYDF